jgi:hypothetical protein
MDNTVVDAGQAAVAWTFPVLVTLAVLGGALGGLAEFTSKFTLGEKRPKIFERDPTIGRTFLCILNHVLTGIAGAAAAAFVFSSTTWFPNSDTAQHRLWLLTLSLVAGFGARSVLPMVTRRLQRQINELEEEVQESKELAKEVDERSQGRDILARAMALLGSSTPPTQIELNSSSLELSEWIRNHPLDRSATIVASRLCRALKNLDEGVRTLTFFIDRKAAAGQLDTDYADALYQRACYQCLIWAEDQNKNPELLGSGLQDVVESIKYNESNKRAFLTDTDFQPWRTEVEFVKLVS